MDHLRYRLDELASIPSAAGIYAIVNDGTGERYVGKAINIRRRIAEHVRDLDLGREATNADQLLQFAWTTFGRQAFVIEVLEEVTDNEAETHYHIRPDNLSLAEHYYINQGAAYNKDRHIVADRFRDLVEVKGWRDPIDDATRDLLAKARPHTYLVAQRKTGARAVIVLGFNEKDAKRRALEVSPEIALLGGNVAARRLSSALVTKALSDGAVDARSTSCAGGTSVGQNMTLMTSDEMSPRAN